MTEEKKMEKGEIEKKTQRRHKVRGNEGCINEMQKNGRTNDKEKKKKKRHNKGRMKERNSE